MHSCYWFLWQGTYLGEEDGEASKGKWPCEGSWSSGLVWADSLGGGWWEGCSRQREEAVRRLTGRRDHGLGGVFIPVAVHFL